MNKNRQIRWNIAIYAALKRCSVLREDRGATVYCAVDTCVCTCVCAACNKCEAACVRKRTILEQITSAPRARVCVLVCVQVTPMTADAVDRWKEGQAPPLLVCTFPHTPGMRYRVYAITHKQTNLTHCLYKTVQHKYIKLTKELAI